MKIYLIVNNLYLNDMRIKKIKNFTKKLEFKRRIFSLLNKEIFLNIIKIKRNIFKKLFRKIKTQIYIFNILQLLNYKYNSKIFLGK